MLVLQLLLSFVVGGLFVSGSLLVAERLGTVAGGVVAGLPSTSAISILFIAEVSGITTAVETAHRAPVVLAFAGFFLVTYAILSERAPPDFALLLSVVIWLFLAAAYIAVSPLGGWATAFTFITFFLFSRSLLRSRRFPEAPRSRVSPGMRQLLLRGTIAGTIISSAVLAAKIGGALLGAIVGNFPASYFSTLFIASRTKGPEFSRSLIPSMFLSGQINIIIYLSAVQILYPAAGVFWGTSLSYLLSIGSGLCLYRSMQMRAFPAPAGGEPAEGDAGSRGRPRMG